MRLEYQWEPRSVVIIVNTPAVQLNKSLYKWGMCLLPIYKTRYPKFSAATEEESFEVGIHNHLRFLFVTI